MATYRPHPPQTVFASLATYGDDDMTKRTKQDWRLR
jgi:hypothetical protein